MKKELYPIRAAARLTRLTVDTLRAWERRYGVVSPQRKNGARFYTQEEIDRLSLLREALEQGHSIGHVAGLGQAELRKLLAARRPSKASVPVTERDPLASVIAAVENFAYREADLELGRLVWITSPRDMVHRVALPLMRLAGQRWHDRRIRVAHEHMLTQLLTNLMGSMIRVYSPERPPARVMTATLSGDLHAFGILAATMLVVSAGLGVIPLGADLPAEELSYAAKRSGARVVLVSVTSTAEGESSLDQLSALGLRLSKDTELWIGVNPPDLASKVNLKRKGFRVLRDFEELETQLKRIGGRF